MHSIASIYRLVPIVALMASCIHGPSKKEGSVVTAVDSHASLARLTSRKLEWTQMTALSQGPETNDASGVSLFDGARRGIDSTTFELPQSDWSGAAVRLSSSLSDFGSTRDTHTGRRLQSTTSISGSTTGASNGTFPSCTLACSKDCPSR
jgi:hypothetical protein